MRTYTRRPSDTCPSGAHISYSPDPDNPARDIATTVDCDCPWLVISETDPVPHMMVWPTKASVQRLIGEFDAGYFDTDDMPRRAGSQFLSPHVSDMLDLVQAGDLMGAVMRLLAQVTVDRIAWYGGAPAQLGHGPLPAMLGLRIPFDGRGRALDSWVVFSFTPGETVQVDRCPGDDLPEELAENVVWDGRPEPGYPVPSGDLSGKVSAMLADAGFTPTDPDHTTHLVTGLLADAMGDAGFQRPPVDGYHRLAEMSAEEDARVMRAVGERMTLAGMKRSELVAEAKRLGHQVSQRTTRAELVDLVAFSRSMAAAAPAPQRTDWMARRGELMAMTRPWLQREAKALGCSFNSSTTKGDLVDLIIDCEERIAAAQPPQVAT